MNESFLMKSSSQLPFLDVPMSCHGDESSLPVQDLPAQFPRSSPEHRHRGQRVPRPSRHRRLRPETF